MNLPAHQGYKPQTTLLTARLSETKSGVPGQCLPEALAQGCPDLLLKLVETL